MNKISKKTQYNKKSRTTKHSQTTQKKQNLKYCCSDKKNKKQCAKIYTTLNINPNHKPKYAITTLLFGSDSYLPGILLLGSSIRQILPKEYEKYFTLCCMVTPDINKSTRNIILKIYDKLIEVDYLQISPHLIKHKEEKIRNIYSKTFTKLRIFEMIEYDKVLFLDADIIVLKKDIFSLFNLNTPAVVFLGKLSNKPTERYFKDFNEGRLFKQFQNKYCNWKGKELHGNLIPYDKYENENISNGMNIETSLLLITPSKFTSSEIQKYLQNIKHKNIKISGDTELISRFFKNKLYAIEPCFFGRWVNPEEHPELVVLDLYGNEKPWDIKKFTELLLFIDVGDIPYWWNTYIKYYEEEYSKYDNKMLDILYKTIKDEYYNKYHNKIYNKVIEIFTSIYETNYWGDNNNKKYKGTSGDGSSIEYNKNTYIPFLRNFIEKYKIKTIVDLGCGDFRIGLTLYDKLNIEYTGYDAYEGVINFNKDKFKEHPNFNFIHSDFSAEEYREYLEEADLCIIKDVLQHWPTKNVIEFMDFITKSKKYKYILLINCFFNIEAPKNDYKYRKDIILGDVSSLSSSRFPLNKYGGEILYTWDTKEISLITL